MKIFRAFIVILLAVLLPIRGAVAAAMLCPGGSAANSIVVAGDDGAHALHAAALAPPCHGAGHGHSHSGSPGGEHAAAADLPADPAADAHATACPFCAGGCCVTPLAFAPPAVERSPLSHTAVFPPLTARVTAHCPDGQDRPPQRC